MTLSDVYTCCQNIHPDAVFYVYKDIENFYAEHKDKALESSQYPSLATFVWEEVDYFNVVDEYEVHVLLKGADEECE